MESEFSLIWRLVEETFLQMLLTSKQTEWPNYTYFVCILLLILLTVNWIKVSINLKGAYNSIENSANSHLFISFTIKCSDFPGVFAAAHDLKTEWVVVKGIKDYVDGSQSSNDEWGTFASVMAASVVANILSDAVIFEDWPHYNTGNASSAIPLCHCYIFKISQTFFGFC